MLRRNNNHHFVFPTLRGQGYFYGGNGLLVSDLRKVHDGRLEQLVASWQGVNENQEVSQSVLSPLKTLYFCVKESTKYQHIHIEDNILDQVCW